MQAPLAWAIEGLREWRESNRRVMNARADACRASLSRLTGWQIDAQGAYFAYLRHPWPGISSWRVAEELAVRRGLATLPGEAFGHDQTDHLRIAFANVESERLDDVALRLHDFKVA